MAVRLWCQIAALVLVCQAATGSTADPAEAARLYGAGDWAAAAAVYRPLSDAEPGNGSYAYRLAVSLRRSGDTASAQAALERAAASGVPAGYLDLERVKLALAAGDRTAALATLEAAGESVAAPVLITGDQELDTLADSPEYAAAVARAETLAAPCEHMPEARQFDFWVGTWRVEDAGGNVAGENSIRKAELGCVLVENWTSASGGTGMSINYYDPAHDQWVQNWVGLNLLIDTRGGLKDGSMVMEGTVHYYRQGTTTPFRGTWTPREDGVVRQHFEHSTDGGATWSTWFDGYYHRIE